MVLMSWLRVKLRVEVICVLFHTWTFIHLIPLVCRFNFFTLHMNFSNIDSTHFCKQNCW